ncbi:MAG: hypothetical protein D6706_12135 [Chloroflexi bacterium]|nr:MAG: hypothetical protein D6706_12135 [Chloroflexota bacterium]
MTQNEQQTISHPTLIAVFSQPTPAALWALRGELLVAGLSPETAVFPILTQFYQFLASLRSSLDAHQYSKFASLLDIGAVGGVALESLLQKGSSSDFWQRLLAGGLSEGLMVMASRQYIKAFQAEMTAVYDTNAWFLYDAFWQLATTMQPQTPPQERRDLLDHLFAPIHNPNLDNSLKAALLGRLYQILLFAHLEKALSEVKSP